MKTRYSKKGFTVMELLVGITAFAIMVSAVGSILVVTWKSWVQNRDSIAMQRDATIAMRMLAREIRRTPVSQGTFNINVGDTLTCVNTNGTFVFSRSDSGDLDMQTDGGDTITLVYDDCTHFTSFFSTNGAVVVEWDLSTQADSSLNTMIIYPRN